MLNTISLSNIQIKNTTNQTSYSGKIERIYFSLFFPPNAAETLGHYIQDNIRKFTQVMRKLTEAGSLDSRDDTEVSALEFLFTLRISDWCWRG